MQSIVCFIQNVSNDSPFVTCLFALWWLGYVLGVFWKGGGAGNSFTLWNLSANIVPKSRITGRFDCLGGIVDVVRCGGGGGFCDGCCEIKFIFNITSVVNGLTIFYNECSWYVTWHFLGNGKIYQKYVWYSL